MECSRSQHVYGLEGCRWAPASHGGMVLKHTLLVAGVTAIAFSVPAFSSGSAAVLSAAGSESTSTTIVLAQALPPAPPPAVVATPAPDASVVIAPSAPPPPEVEAPPAPPAPRYVWEPGHWLWNGTQFLWDQGKYVEKPTAATAYVAGHWQEYSDGWGWVPGHWDYAGVGSSSPPR